MLDALQAVQGCFNPLRGNLAVLLIYRAYLGRIRISVFQSSTRQFSGSAWSHLWVHKPTSPDCFNPLRGNLAVLRMASSAATRVLLSRLFQSSTRQFSGSARGFAWPRCHSTRSRLFQSSTRQFSGSARGQPCVGLKLYFLPVSILYEAI